MRLGVGRGVGWLAWAVCGLVACGESSSKSDEPGTDAGTDPGTCSTSPQEVQHEDTLPARLEATLCEEGDEVSLSMPRTSDDPSLGIVHLHLARGAGSYAVDVLASVGGALAPVPTSTESSTFALSAAAPDAYFIPYFLDYDDERMTLTLSGTAGQVTLEVDRPALAPSLACSGKYEGLPVDTPPLTLPADFELELCSGRDSRVFAATVAAGRPVEVTLENPESIDTFSFSVYRDQTNYEPLMVTEGATQTYLGLAAQRSLRFVPAEAGIVAFYAGGGISRGERSRLHVEQP